MNPPTASRLDKLPDPPLQAVSEIRLQAYRDLLVAIELHLRLFGAGDEPPEVWLEMARDSMRALIDATFHCKACGREESMCSADPCSTVITERTMRAIIDNPPTVNGAQLATLRVPTPEPGSEQELEDRWGDE